MHQSRTRRGGRYEERVNPQGRNRRVRWDIQGLRAFAVLAVVADHLFDYPRGGFVGVDIFFVISGFLISSHLVHQAETTGHIHWIDFYRRRVKRIIPAAVLVLVVTVIASYATFNTIRADSVRTDSVWALLFGANWRFMNLETDYFNAGGPVSPLQHYWSLSIEEQFYFVWPLLLLAVYFILRRLAKHHQRTAAGVVMASIIGASFVWALLQTSSDPTSAYFSTFTRVWELGIGALLAVSVPLLVRIPDQVRVPAAWLGFVGMIIAVWVVDPDQGFPAPWAALPVLATAVVIAAGTFEDRTRQQRLLAPLTNPVSNYVGDISYSLYLWHFPVIIIGTAALGDEAGTKILLLVAMFVISVFAYHLWEDPLRYGRLPFHDHSYKLLVVGALAAVTTAMVAVALRPIEAPESALTALGGESSVGDPTNDEPAVRYGPRVSALQGEIAQALADTSWPELDPPVEEVIGVQKFPEGLGPCAEPTVATPPAAECTWGDVSGKQKVLLVGDSISMSWAAGMIDFYGTSASSIRVMSMSGCPMGDVDVLRGSDIETQACARRHAEVYAVAQESRPDLIIVANTSEVQLDENTGAPMDIGVWERGLASSLDKLKRSATRVVVVSSPPNDKDIRECYTPQSTPVDCTSVITPEWSDMHRRNMSAAATAGVIAIDSRPLFCNEDGLCPPYVAGVVTRPDRTHMTTPYVMKILPAFAELLAAAKPVTEDQLG